MRLPYLRLTLFLCLGFALLLALVQMQPPTNPARAFLADIEACVSSDPNAPCDLGVRPLHTNLEALDGFIRDHAWVADARFSRGMEIDSGYLAWTWSGTQPSAFDDASSGGLWLQEGVVLNVMLPTTLKLGDIWLTLPPAQDSQMFGASVMPLRLYYQLDYFEGALRVEVEITCPITPARLWNAAVKLNLGMRPLRAIPENARDLALATMRTPMVALPEWGHCL
ncbi:MAG: hypothetical protein SGI73_02100 [Chloroflexota bacterium]|nr:hypothetical protein [Chloroflexota bacterium]